MVPLSDDVYRESRPIAGVLDPDTLALDPQGKYFYFASEPVWRTRAGALSRYITNGGGGWGEPLTRDPERVMRDVRNGYVSQAAAKESYGVVVVGDPERDPDGLIVDVAATAKLRIARKSSSGP